MTGQVHVEAIDLNPLHWLGSAASAAVGDVWKAAMTGLWSAALWLLKLAFTVIDAFTTPDLSASGPMGAVLPTTLWIGAALAVIMMFVQLALALARRDGKSLGRIILGIGQFGLIWVGFLGMAAVLVAAASGLEHGILHAMLGANDLSDVDLSGSFSTQVGDITLATVLGILGLLIVIPAAFFYILIMFVREAALIILVATAPISAAGLVSEAGKAWFWKTLRWFFACLLISPMAALVLGIGVKLSTGVINPPTPPGHDGAGSPSGNTSLQDVADYANQSATAHAGMAVIGCIVIAVGACCPLILFRLLAFVEPSTASGVALRQSWADAGGMSGLVHGGSSSGSQAALRSGNDGRSGGESGAETQTTSRFAQAAGMLGPVGTAFGAGLRGVHAVASRAADIGSDVLGQGGVGSPGYSMTPTDASIIRRDHAGSSSRGAAGSSGDGGLTPDPSGGTGDDGPQPPEPPTPPTPPAPGPGGKGPRGGGGLGRAAGAGEAGSGAEAAAVAL